jgi:hypothetical protein
VGERADDADEDVRRGRVGVVGGGGLDGVRAMDATFEIICEICARSLDAPMRLEVMGVETDLGR